MTTRPNRIIELVRATRTGGFLLGSLLTLLAASPGAGAEQPLIVFFGDSLTAGYGVEAEQAYPALIQEMLDEADFPHQVVNAGLSGETSAAGLRRVDWILRRPADVFVLALGGNDGLRGIPTEETQRNLDGIFQKVARNDSGTSLILAGMETPPNMGVVFTTAFRQIFPPVAEKWDATLIPFLLEGVGGEPEFNLPDGIHPNPEGHRIIAEKVWTYLEPVLIGRTRRGALQEDAPSRSNISKASGDDTSP